MPINAGEKDGFVDAGPSWALLNELIGEGYSKTDISFELGINSGLQIGKVRIRNKMAGLIKEVYERLHDQLITEEAKVTTTQNGKLCTRTFRGYTVHEHRMR